MCLLFHVIVCENMADRDEELESPSCHAMIGTQSLANGTPNSPCSTPDLDLRGNENCFGIKASQTSKCGGFSTVNSASNVPFKLNSTPMLHSKKQGYQTIDSCSMDRNSKAKQNECSNASNKKDGNHVECKWMSCHVSVKNASELSEHVRLAHVEPMSTQDVFVCLWEGCKVFDKPSLSHSWLSKHVNAHTGVKPFKCMISGCPMSFSSREGLARHVPSHFNDSKPTKRQKSENDSSPRKVLKRKKKKIRIIRQARPPAQVKEDFVDPHAVDSIKERLPHVMPVSCYRLGIDGANIIFQSKVFGRRTDEKSGEIDVLLKWLPEDVLPDEWVPLTDLQKHRTRTVHISQLPNDVAADLDPSFYRRFSHRKHRRK